LSDCVRHLLTDNFGPRPQGRLRQTWGDEIAVSVVADPIEFRMKYTDPADTRGLEVLDRLAKLAKWEKRGSPQKNINGNIVKGRGARYGKYELVRTYIGAVQEVEVNRVMGDVSVVKFYVVHDCGQIINPTGVRAQIEGCIIQTVSRTLKEELSFDRAMVTSLDWATYPILTFLEVLEIELIDRPAEKPWGAGEPAAAVVSSSISNAVFDATGIRLRSVPFRREKVRAALKSS
jgi:nicotinate dehydrogenase subunit B